MAFDYVFDFIRNNNIGERKKQSGLDTDKIHQVLLLFWFCFFCFFVFFQKIV